MSRCHWGDTQSKTAPHQNKVTGQWERLERGWLSRSTSDHRVAAWLFAVAICLLAAAAELRRFRRDRPVTKQTWLRVDPFSYLLREPGTGRGARATLASRWCSTTMTFSHLVFVGLLGLLLCPESQAGLQRSSPNRYQSITERNVFHLVPEPPPPPPPRPPLPEVALTGITTILEGQRALLKIRYPAKPGAPAREEECILKPGEKEGPVEVLEIDEANERVTVNNSGTIMTITFAPAGPEHGTSPAQRVVRHPPFFRERLNYKG